MIWLSIKEITEIYDQKCVSVKRALQKGLLKGEKDAEGKWRVLKEDVEKYYLPPKEPEWSTLECVSINFGVTIQKLTEDMQEGILITKKFKGVWYVYYEDLNVYVRKRKLQPKKEECWCEKAWGSFVVINSNGIHMRPSGVICEICRKYGGVVIFLKYERFTWSYTGWGSMGRLLSLEIGMGANINVEAWGKDSRKAVDTLLDSAKNRFGVPLFQTP